MSQKSGKALPPPFLQSRKRGRVTTTHSEQVSLAQKKQDPPAVVENQQLKEPSKQLSPKRRGQDGPPKDPQLLPPPSSSSRTVIATPTQHLFGALGTKYSEGEEATGWWTADPDENSQAVAKCLAEAFIRQSAHSKSFKQLSLSHAEQKKKIQRLEWQVVEDKRSLEAEYKKQLSYETAQTRTDLNTARRERNELEESLKELQRSSEEAAKSKNEEIARLTGELEAAKAELATAEETFEAQGQVSFMMGFIRKVPDFDWDRLGPGNAEFAESLKQRIAQEDAEEARLAAEARLAEEAKLAEEARLVEEAQKTQQDNAAA